MGSGRAVAVGAATAIAAKRIVNELKDKAIDASYGAEDHPVLRDRSGEPA